MTTSVAQQSQDFFDALQALHAAQAECQDLGQRLRAALLSSDQALLRLRTTMDAMPGEDGRPLQNDRQTPTADRPDYGAIIKLLREELSERLRYDEGVLPGNRVFRAGAFYGVQVAHQVLDDVFFAVRKAFGDARDAT